MLYTIESIHYISKIIKRYFIKVELPFCFTSFILFFQRSEPGNIKTFYTFCRFFWVELPPTVIEQVFLLIPVSKTHYRHNNSAIALIRQQVVQFV